jgi:RNA polymerase sigma factor (sigma-70 family)
MGDGDMLDLVTAYEPLVAKMAFKYGGRGAEVEDLRQVSYMALLVLARRVSRKRLGLALSNFVPGMVRDAAAKMRYRGCEVRMTCDDDGDEGGDPLETLAAEDRTAAEDRDRVELMDALERLLTPSDLEIAEKLMRGFTQGEIAAEMGVSQQAISKRVQRIRLLASSLRN